MTDEVAAGTSAVLGGYLVGRYETGRDVRIEPSINNEVLVYVTGTDPIVLDALDLLRLTADVVLGDVYGWSTRSVRSTAEVPPVVADPR
jgi:hypothetical protein